MEQEKSMYQLKNAGKLTGELLVKGLLLFFEKGEELVDLAKNRPMVGEQKWNRFIATDGFKEIKEFRTTEANLEQLRSVLNMYDISFSVRTLEDGLTQLAFESKNRSVMESAFKKVIERATNPKTAAEFGKLLASPPDKKTFEERLEEAEKKSKELEVLQEKQLETGAKVTRKTEEAIKS